MSSITDKEVFEALVYFAKVAGWATQEVVPGITRIVVRNTYWADATTHSERYQLAAEMCAFLYSKGVKVGVGQGVVSVGESIDIGTRSHRMGYDPTDPESTLMATIVVCSVGASWLDPEYGGGEK